MALFHSAFVYLLGISLSLHKQQPWHCWLLTPSPADSSSPFLPLDESRVSYEIRARRAGEQQDMVPGGQDHGRKEEDCPQQLQA